MEIGASASIQGIHNAVAAHSARAERLSQPEKHENLEKDLAQLPSDPQHLSAQRQALRAYDEMLGTLLDIVG